MNDYESYISWFDKQDREEQKRQLAVQRWARRLFIRELDKQVFKLHKKINTARKERDEMPFADKKEMFKAYQMDKLTDFEYKKLRKEFDDVSVPWATVNLYNIEWLQQQIRDIESLIDRMKELYKVPRKNHTPYSAMNYDPRRNRSKFNRPHPGAVTARNKRREKRKEEKNNDE